MSQNRVKDVREKLLMSKAELARKAGISAQTINRIENENTCRLETKRKIILALGYALSDKDKIFPEVKNRGGVHIKKGGNGLVLPK